MTAYEDQLAVVQAELDKLLRIQAEAREEDPAEIGLVTGFVAVVESTTYESNGDQAFGTYWAASMGMSVPHLLGVLRHGERIVLADLGYGKCHCE